MVDFYKVINGYLIAGSGSEVLDDTFSTDWSLLTKDVNGDWYDYYVLDDNGMYQPDLVKLDLEKVELLKVLKRSERDLMLIESNYAVMDAEDRGEDTAPLKAWRVELKDFPNHPEKPTWYEQELPTKPE
jgi:hypothetical protein